MNKDQIIEAIKEMSVLELNELVQACEEEFGVSAAAGVVVAAAGAAGEAAEEKTEFDVVLEGFDAAAKIKVIKIVREVTGLGLADAKAAVEGAPTTLKEAVSKEDGEAIKAQLGVDVDRKRIVRGATIKTAGRHAVEINLYRDINAKVIVLVGDEPVAEEPAAEEAAEPEAAEAADEAAETTEAAE